MSSTSSHVVGVTPAPSLLTPAEFNFVADLLRQRSGLALTPDKGYLVETRLAPIAKAHAIADLHALVALLQRDPRAPLVAEIVEAMTTNESLFFRDTKPFDHLKSLILPQLWAAGKRSIRIWSAACSTGQEPYSIAMVLAEEAAKYPGLEVEIYATDIAEKVLERGRAGVYTQFEVQRGLPIALLMKYFTQREGNQWAIQEALKARVKFAPANLLTSFAALGKFDIIFCRNVLIYFDEKTKGEVLDRMAGTLNAPGYLFLGGSESTYGLTQRFVPNEAYRGLFSLA